MKRFLVVIILFLLIGGGGAGGLIMLGVIPNPFNPTQHGPMSAAEEAAAKAQAAAKKFNAPEAVIPFVDLRDMIVPVVLNGQIKTRVYISVRLWVAPGQKDPVELQIARYEDAVIAEFIPYFSSYFGKNDMLNLEDIKSRMVKLAKRLYGDKVNDVLIVNVFEQKFGQIE